MVYVCIYCIYIHSIIHIIYHYIILYHINMMIYYDIIKPILFEAEKFMRFQGKPQCCPQVIASCGWQMGVEILQQMRTAALQADAQGYGAVMRTAGAPNRRSVAEVISILFGAWQFNRP